MALSIKNFQGHWQRCSSSPCLLSSYFQRSRKRMHTENTANGQQMRHRQSRRPKTYQADCAVLHGFACVRVSSWLCNSSVFIHSFIEHPLGVGTVPGDVVANRHSSCFHRAQSLVRKAGKKVTSKSHAYLHKHDKRQEENKIGRWDLNR